MFSLVRAPWIREGVQVFYTNFVLKIEMLAKVSSQLKKAITLATNNIFSSFQSPNLSIFSEKYEFESYLGRSKLKTRGKCDRSWRKSTRIRFFPWPLFKGHFGQVDGPRRCWHNLYPKYHPIKSLNPKGHLALTSASPMAALQRLKPKTLKVSFSLPSGASFSHVISIILNIFYIFLCP